MKENGWLSVKTLPLVLMGYSMLLVGCHDEQGGAQQGAGQHGTQKQQVDVVVVERKPVNVTATLPARTAPFLVAEIRPQVNGTILKREFEEGSIVKAGQSLYQIDPAIYQAAYDSAKANLASAKANAKVSQLTTVRYRSLLNTKSISQQEYDQQAALSDQAKAAVEVAQAQLDQAKINLDYTRVYSPITGRIGKSSVTEGALVTANQAAALAIVQQIDPIYVDMTQAANNYLTMQHQLETGILQRLDDKATVTLMIDNNQTYSHPGNLQFSDIKVNETTGTIALRALFENPGNTLLPGMFIRAELYEGTLAASIVIPQKALTRDAKGNATVMIVNPQGLVESRPVVANQTVGNGWLIDSGLEVGDKVIISALQKVQVGSPVDINSPQPNNNDPKNKAAQVVQSSK